jgi:hypothetical protein
LGFFSIFWNPRRIPQTESFSDFFLPREVFRPRTRETFPELPKGKERPIAIRLMIHAKCSALEVLGLSPSGFSTHVALPEYLEIPLPLTHPVAAAAACLVCLCTVQCMSWIGLHLIPSTPTLALARARRGAAAWHWHMAGMTLLLDRPGCVAGEILRWTHAGDRRTVDYRGFGFSERDHVMSVRMPFWIYSLRGSFDSGVQCDD